MAIDPNFYVFTPTGVALIVPGSGVTITQTPTRVFTFSATGGGGGVSSLNALTGALSITSTGSTLTVTAAGSAVNTEVNLTHANTWTGLQNGTIQASSLTSGAVDGATLKVVSNAAAIDLTHANTWTGLQTFSAGASATTVTVTAALFMQGGYHANITVPAVATYAVVGTDEVILLDSSVTSVVNLQAVASTRFGRKIMLIQTDSGTGGITINANSADTIEGATSKTLSAQNQKIGILSDGSNTWYNLGSAGVS